jgi:hypothetical protein
MVTFAQIISRARVMIGDTAEPYRFDDATFLVWAAEAQSQVAARRPDCLVTATGILADPPETVLTTDALDIHVSFAEALVQYLCYQAWLSTGEHASNAARADVHLKLFAAELA